MELAGGASVYSREALKFNAGTGSYAPLQEVYRHMGGAAPCPASPPDAGRDGAQQQVASDGAVLHRGVASSWHHGAQRPATCEFEAAAAAAAASPGAQQSRTPEAPDTVTGALEASDAAAEHGMFATRFPPHQQQQQQRAARDARSEGASDAPPWHSMPDVVTTVLLRLSDGRDLAKCAGVCRLWNKEAGSEKVWQHLVLRRWCVMYTCSVQFQFFYMYTCIHI